MGTARAGRCRTAAMVSLTECHPTSPDCCRCWCRRARGCLACQHTTQCPFQQINSAHRRPGAASPSSPWAPSSPLVLSPSWGQRRVRRPARPAAPQPLSLPRGPVRSTQQRGRRDLSMGCGAGAYTLQHVAHQSCAGEGWAGDVGHGRRQCTGVMAARSKGPASMAVILRHKLTVMVVLCAA